jgi:hypothetical protein
VSFSVSRIIRGLSSAGRAPALHAGGQRFDPARLHHTYVYLRLSHKGSVTTMIVHIEDVLKVSSIFEVVVPDSLVLGQLFLRNRKL